MGVLYVREGGAWVPVSGGATMLDGLTDVTIAGAAHQNVLAFDSSVGQWVNQPIPAQPLNWLTDVSAAPPTTDGDVLTYENSSGLWKPKPGSGIITEVAGPTVTTDCLSSVATTLVTTTINVVAGTSYRVDCYVQGSQITAASTYAYFQLNAAGPIALTRLSANTGVPVNIVFAGTISRAWVAPTTGTQVLTVIGWTNASALRVNANLCTMTIARL